MLTLNDDVDTDILLSLSLHDMRNFCKSSMENMNYCHNNLRLQKKIKRTTDMVNKVLSGFKTKLIATVIMTKLDFMKLLGEYHIHKLDYYLGNILVNNLLDSIYYVDIFTYAPNHYLVTFSECIPPPYNFNCPDDVQNLKSLLFYLFYDDIFRL